MVTIAPQGPSGSVRVSADPPTPESAALQVSPPTAVEAGSTPLVRRLLGAAALAVVGIGGVAYSLLALSHDGDAVRAAATSRPSAATTAPAPTAALTPSVTPARGLAAPLFVPPVPWQALPDDLGQTGRVNLARAVSIDGHGELSKTGLQQLGFVVGQSRSWQTSGAALLVLDYTFRDARGAAGFVTYGRRARDGDRAFSRQPVKGVPGAVGYQVRRPGSSTDVALFSRGRSAYLIGIQGTPPPGAAGDVGALAVQQYTAAGG